MKRRDFLKTSGYFVAAASLAGAACSDSPDNKVPEGTYDFPHGVASGDPRATSVVLWTRVAATSGSAEPIAVTAQVSTTPDFSSLVLEETYTVTAASDHTLRLVITELAPGTFYYYRFTAGVDASRIGRTLTAPPTDDTAPVRLAWVSCQDYGAGFYGAYRELIKDDLARPANQQIQLVVHLGDFIYETVEDGFQGAIDESFEPILLTDRDGDPRTIEPLPGGGAYARTLADYRHLYKQFLRDPDLQEARARWPFIVTWDDHEFTNDAWQTQANYTGGDSLDEPAQTRKVAANQAWFEYTPAMLSDAPGVPGVLQDASDFQAAQVADAPYAEVDGDNQITESNSRMAIDSMTIYRSFRYGQNMELVITDERSYRSDHAVPEELTDGHPAFFDPRNAMPMELVNVLDAGRTANDGDPPDTVLDMANPRKDAPPGTMLGPRQKEWWKATMRSSDATWKIWGNEVPLLRVLVKNQPANILLVDRMMNADAWDGYNTERKELMGFLRDEGIQNVVVITGDVHAHFASLIMDDFDAAAPEPVAVELCAAGVASNSLFSFYESATRPPQPAQLRDLVTYDARPLGGTEAFANNLNVMFQYGTSAALAALETTSIEDIVAARDPEVNPHLLFTSTDAQGYGLLTITPTQVTATLVTVNRPITDTGEAGPGVKCTATFVVPKDDPASTDGPVFTGAPPFPYA